MLIKTLCFIEFKTPKENSSKLLFVFMCCLLYIIINFFKENNLTSSERPEIDIRKILYNSNNFIYQGKKLLKSKLIGEYLDRVSNEYISDKIEEKKNSIYIIILMNILIIQKIKKK